MKFNTGIFPEQFDKSGRCSHNHRTVQENMTSFNSGETFRSRTDVIDPLEVKTVDDWLLIDSVSERFHVSTGPQLPLYFNTHRNCTNSPYAVGSD